MTSRSLLAAALVGASLFASSVAPTTAAAAGRSPRPLELAVIGDTPYGPDQSDPEAFAGLLGDIAADDRVRAVVHVGDIKNGSTRCDDVYYDQIAADFAASPLPIFYTPGDNEWTDCHRTNNGGYDPYERLASLRATFFAEPGQYLGRMPRVISSQDGEFVENVRWVDPRVVFATVHVVGSNNGLAPWTGELETPENRLRREAEVARRIAAAVDWIDETFDVAEAAEAPGVILAMQADTFFADPIASGFTEVVQEIEGRSAAFGGEVLLLQGDTHDYLVDEPLDDAPNLTRIVVEGETVDEWLELRIDPGGGELFTWRRVSR